MTQPNHEKFVHLQEALRHAKGEHGFDFTHKNGVVIDDQLYPAVGKQISAGGDEYGDIYEMGLYIPLENGLRAWANLNRPHKQDYQKSEPKGTISMNLEVPAIQLYGGQREYDYGTAMHHGEDAFWEVLKSDDSYMKGSFATHKSPHELLNKWSKLPYQGSVHWGSHPDDWEAFLNMRPKYKNHQFVAGYYDIDSEDLALTEDELNEHRKNYKRDNVRGDGIPPSHIHYTYIHPTTNDEEEHLYNVETEELKRQ